MASPKSVEKTPFADRVYAVLHSGGRNFKVDLAAVKKLIAEESTDLSDSQRLEVHTYLRTYKDRFASNAQQHLHAWVTKTGSRAPRSVYGLANPRKRAAVTRALTNAAFDGISRRELEDIAKDLADKFGEKQARQILIQALTSNDNTQHLDLDAVSWLQTRYGQMQGHIARYQEVLVDRLGDAKLLDANFNGRIDAGDMVFAKDASGQVNTRNISRALIDDVRIGSAIIDAAYAMEGAGHNFSLTDSSGFPKDKWEPDRFNPATYRPKGKPSEAINDLFERPWLYGFECATAIMIIYYKAILDLIGPDDFDAANSDMRIGMWIGGSIVDGNLRMINNLDSRPARPKDLKDLRVGDQVHFKNYEASAKAYAKGWAGENVIYLGNGLYYGHPFGVTHEESIVLFLDGWRKEGATRRASLIRQKRRLSANFFRHDRRPGPQR